MLSHSAFIKDNVRVSVWKEPFQYFLPLVISPDHFNRSKELILSSLANIAGACHIICFPLTLRQC